MGAYVEEKVSFKINLGVSLSMLELDTPEERTEIIRGYLEEQLSCVFDDCMIFNIEIIDAEKD